MLTSDGLLSLSSDSTLHHIVPNENKLSQLYTEDRRHELRCWLQLQPAFVPLDALNGTRPTSQVLSFEWVTGSFEDSNGPAESPAAD